MIKLWSSIHPCSKFCIRRRDAIEIRSECDKEKVAPAGKQNDYKNK